jgi:hypothetical protein
MANALLFPSKAMPSIASTMSVRKASEERHKPGIQICVHNENRERSGPRINGLKRVMLNHDGITYIATISLEFKEFTFSYEFLNNGKSNSYS